MNVLFIVSWFNNYGEDSKAGVFHYEFAKAIKKYSDCNVAIFFPFDNAIDSFYYETTIDDILIFRTNSIDNKLKRLVNYKKTISNIREQFKFDIIHAHCATSAGKVALIFSLLSRKPYCVTEHLLFDFMSLNNPIKYLKTYFIYFFSSFNICVSDYLNNDLCERFKRIKFQTIFNGVEKPDPNNMLSIKMDNNCVNCCIVALMYSKTVKGLQYLLPAIKNYNNQNDLKIKLHICGGGEFLNYFIDMANELDINDYVLFYGDCEKELVYSVIDKMDFCVSSSLFESAGVAVEEYLISGKPVLVTNSGGADSLVDESNSVIVKKGEVDSLEIGLELMAKKYKTFNKQYIKESAIDKFHFKTIVEKHIDNYIEILRI